MLKKSLLLTLSLSAFMGGAALADDAEYVITEKDKIFSPATLTVPANQKIKITIKNLDASTAEFESSDFDREKVVGANSSVVTVIGPLKPGNYSYVDDFHHASTGTIVAK